MFVARFWMAPPPRPVRHEELVLVGVGPRDVLGHAVGDELLGLLLEAVGQALEEEEAEDVGLVVAAVDRPAQDVGGRPEVPLELLDAQRFRRGGGRLDLGRGRLRPRGGAGLPRRAGPADEPLDEIALLSARVVEIERSAELLQTIPGEFPQHLVERSPPRYGQGVDELVPHAPIVDVEIVVVGVDAELVAGQLRENGAFRRHGRVNSRRPSRDRNEEAVSSAICDQGVRQGSVHVADPNARFSWLNSRPTGEPR